jgi:hypothetical protein
MIDETFRQISSRESVQDYMNYTNKRKAQIAHEKKLEFEESLRQSAVREVKSGSSLFGASKNIFETALTKDTAKTLSLMERKRKMQISMNSMINDLNEPDFNRFESVMTEYSLSPKTS